MLVAGATLIRGLKPTLWEPASEEFLPLWEAKFLEAVDNYAPDLVWFDMGFGWVIPEKLRQRVVAEYYNRAAGWGREGAFIYKHTDLDPRAGILDFERGRAEDMREMLWVTDTALGPWYNHKDPTYKSTDRLVDTLVDIVSKNGVMLLNVDPDGNGAIPPQAEQRLREIGDW
jgi:alpha-L-fucosidase